VRSGRKANNTYPCCDCRFHPHHIIFNRNHAVRRDVQFFGDKRVNLGVGLIMCECCRRLGMASKMILKPETCERLFYPDGRA
jgi:hypothetical protein